MKQPPKYRRGERITSMCAALKAIQDGEYLWLRDRPCHPSWLLNMSLWTLMRFCYTGYIRYAVNNWLPVVQ